MRIFIFIIVVMIAQSTIAVQSTNEPNQVEMTSEIENNVDEVKSIVEGRFEDGEELILTMMVGRYIMGDVFAVIDNDKILLEFLPYITLIDFAISESVETRTFSGWYISPSQRFLLDMRDQQVPTLTINNETMSLDPNKVKYINDVLHVEEGYFDEWFDIDHDFKFSHLEMDLLPRVRLPFQEKLLRRNQRIGSNQQSKAQFTELYRGYGLFSPQIFDMQLGARYSDRTQKVNGNYSILGARDIALLHSNIFLSGTDIEPITQGRVTLGRRSSDADLLGFFKASEFQFGDVQPVRQGFSRDRSRGVSLTNSTQNDTLDLQVTNIIGPVQTGWDVELFQNGVLIDLQTDIQIGEFSFLDVPLNVGANEFEIKKYGPQGQVESEFRSKFIDRSLIDNQQLTYAVSLTQSGESVFDVGPDIQEPFDAGYNLSADIRRSLFGISTGFGFQTDFGGDFEQSNATFNANTIVADKWFVGAAVNVSSENRYSASTSLRGNIMGQTLAVNASRSTVNVADQSFSASAIQMRLNGNIKLSRRLNLNYNNFAAVQQGVNEDSVELSNRLGVNTPWVGIYNSISYQSVTKNGAKEENTLGALSLQKGFGRLFARANLNYDLNESFDLNALSGQLNYSFLDGYRATLNGNYNLVNDNYNANLSFGGSNEDFNISTNLGYSHTGEWRLGVNVNFSLSAQPLIYGDIYQTQRAIAQTGSLSVRVFIDANKNAKYDLNETVIPDVLVRSMQSSRLGKTDDLGIATLVGLRTDRLTDIIIEQDSLPDFMLRPVIEGVSIQPRAGYADSLDYPVAMTTEIEGVVSLEIDDEFKPLSRMPLQLLTPKGKVVSETTTEFDGYYVFEGVFDGAYFLSAPKSYTTKNNFHDHVPQHIKIDTSSNEYVIQDVLLKQKTSTKRFLIRLAEFTDERTVKMYALVNATKIKEAKLRLNTLSADGKISLIAGVYDDESVASARCKVLVADSFACEVVPQLIWF